MGFWESFLSAKRSGGLSRADMVNLAWVGARTWTGENLSDELAGTVSGMSTGGASASDSLTEKLLGVQGMNPYVRKRKQLMDWLGAQSGPSRPRDPLVLDLDRSGKIDLENATYFDLNANGFHELTKWVSATDAVMVLDKNFNGKADDGSELFGDAMTLPDGSKALTGFEALRAFDYNGDGKIDESDAIFDSLKLLTGAGEMIGLADAGIRSINLDAEVSEAQGAGLSQEDLSKLTWEERVLALEDQARAADRARWETSGDIRAAGTFEWDDGTTGIIAEALPYRIPMFSIPGEYLEVPEDIAALPDLSGSGDLHDLHQAMARDESGELRALLEQYCEERDPDERAKIFEALLFKWAGAEELEPDARGGEMDARQLAFLEKVFGEEFSGIDGSNPNETAASRLKELYAEISRDMETSLLVKTHLKPFFDQVEYIVTEPVLDEEGNVLQGEQASMSFAPALAWLAEQAEVDPRTALEQLWGLKKILSATDEELELAAEKERTEAELRASYRAKLGLSTEDASETAFDAGSDTDEERSRSDFLSLYQELGLELRKQGGALSDFLDGDISWQGDQVVLTKDGVRYLYGGTGDDEMTGTNNDETFIGGAGSDTYVYNAGGGHDTIRAFSDGTDADRLKLGEGLTRESFDLQEDAGDLLLKLKDGSGSIRLSDWYADDRNRVSEIEFGDGETWKASGGWSIEDYFTSDQSAESGSGSQAMRDLFTKNGLLPPLYIDVPDEFVASKLRMEIAVAGLGFETEGSGQTIDITPSIPFPTEALRLSVPSDTQGKVQFENFDREK